MYQRVAGQSPARTTRCVSWHYTSPRDFGLNDIPSNQHSIGPPAGQVCHQRWLLERVQQAECAMLAEDYSRRMPLQSQWFLLMDVFQVCLPVASLQGGQCGTEHCLRWAVHLLCSRCLFEVFRAFRVSDHRPMSPCQVSLALDCPYAHL